MLENRKHKRRHLIYYLAVMEQETDTNIGFVMDVTKQGIMIMSSMPLTVGKIYHLKMLVNEEDAELKYLYFDASSRWCRQSSDSDFYDTGFELLNLEQDAFIEIDAIIDELGLKEGSANGGWIF